MNTKLNGNIADVHDINQYFLSSPEFNIIAGRLYLNRQAITLLSGLGIADDVFKELQEELLYELGGMFFDDDIAAKSLSLRASQQTTINYRRVVEAGIRLTSEPFFRGLLLAVYRNSIGKKIVPIVTRSPVGVRVLI